MDEADEDKKCENHLIPLRRRTPLCTLAVSCLAVLLTCVPLPSTNTDGAAHTHVGIASTFRVMIFGSDVSQIPCFRESFMSGILSGIGIGLAAFMKTSKPQLASHIAMGSFTMITLVYWSVCRFNWSKTNFETSQLQEALRKKVLYEGTNVEKELEQKGILKSA